MFCFLGGKDGIAGFPDFIYKSIVPACFMAPMKPHFDLRDGQTNLALGECAACLKSILNQRVSCVYFFPLEITSIDLVESKF